MKTEYERNLELALAVLLFLFMLVVIAATCESTSCGSIWLDCPGLAEPRELCGDCYLVSQHVEGDTRYFKFYDCADKETLQSSVSAACTLEGR